MVGVFQLTPASAAQAFQDNGLDALGLTTVMLAPNWGSSGFTYNQASLSLSPTSVVRAPFRGTLEYLDQGNEFRDVFGIPMEGAVAAFRLHPQAILRLNQLCQLRYSLPGDPHHRLIPETMVLAGAAADSSPRTFEPTESLTHTNPVTFHDNRGLTIDPVAVATIFNDLIQTFPALDVSNGGNTGSPGGIATIAGLASGVLVHVTDLHGRVYSPVSGGPGIQKTDSSDAPVGTPDGSGLIELGTGESMAGSGAAADRLRFGWATGGIMSSDALEAPTLPGGVTLPRQFFRMFATDLDWHLCGNRTTSTERGVPGDDGDIPSDLQPAVRDGISIDYIVDGPDVLANSGQVLNRIVGASGANLLAAVSPVFETGVGVANAPGATAHWPAFPASTATGGFPSTFTAPLTGASAAWTAGNDVVVTIGADLVPDGSSVRIYAQHFQLIDSIGETPSFLRGDGGAAIASAGAPTSILVRNPLGLADGDPKPSPATLVFDLVIATRTRDRRIFSARTLLIGAGPAADPGNTFGGTDLMAAVPLNVRSIAPSSLFGIPAPAPPAGSPGNIVDLVRALASETEPRIGPRLPTMGRHETIVATGLEDVAAFPEGLSWDAVLSGARWANETRSASHQLGNPGNPTGPDTLATGIRVTGALGYDLARHAFKRARPLFPLPGGTITDPTFGWIAFLGGDNMDPPVPAQAAVPGTSSGALMQTIAAVTDTPELSLLPPTNVLASTNPITFDDVLQAIADGLNLPSPPNITVTNQDRLTNEVRKEYFTATHGTRDALWSLARVINEAEELVYIDTAGFARTARPSGSPADHEIDLVTLLADRLTAQPNLKVIVSTPRETDFVPAPFVRRAIAQRTEAINLLISAAPDRVVAFHPRGFSGRFLSSRSTTVVVDDVWSIVGATHFRRRGMTFDGSAAITSFDRDIEQGYSRKVRAFRRLAMATKIGVSATDANGVPTAEWIQLHRTSGAFSLIRNLLQQNGAGLISPLWLGPTDDSVLLQSDDVADPDGTDGSSMFALLASLLSEA